ncbi:hypothetical protein B0H17DRAFT_1095987 [Mycena rosella]|uniref:Uncharacterized protein n=1 Tax=Mycena rosella TaxID=1033263 RepID=A0AAD7G662_MYCRO|nr:hypothetical protein B0H17DRAFT_1095987 [Mycena rosella]
MFTLLASTMGLLIAALHIIVFYRNTCGSGSPWIEAPLHGTKDLPSCHLLVSPTWLDISFVLRGRVWISRISLPA